MNAYDKIKHYLQRGKTIPINHETLCLFVDCVNEQADRIAELEKFVGDLKNITDAQGQKGCWDVDNYMTGLFNGLEMALSIFEQREPQFKDTTPKTKPLSDEEIMDIAEQCNYSPVEIEMGYDYEIRIARAIEAKVKGEK